MIIEFFWMLNKKIILDYVVVCIEKVFLTDIFDIYMYISMMQINFNYIIFSVNLLEKLVVVIYIFVNFERINHRIMLVTKKK